MGWKNPFEVITDLFKDNTEKLKELNEELRETNENLRKQNEYLAKAKEKLKEVADKAKDAAGRLPPPPKRLAKVKEGQAAPLASYTPADSRGLQIVQETIRRAEQDAAAGKVETDPKKRN